MQGSVWMGMGQAMSEETGYHDGLLRHRQHARLPRADHPGFAADRGRHRREQRPARAVRRQGGGRGLAGGLPAGAHQRHRRRHRAALQRPAGDARPRVRGDRQAAARQAGSDPRADVAKRAGEGSDPVTGAPDGGAARVRAAAPDDACGRAGGARGPSQAPAARRRHRPRRQHPARHRRAAGADRHERRRRAARHQGRRRAASRSAPPSRWPRWRSTPACSQHYPVVAQAAGSIAGPTHRNMGTVGGNLCLDTRCIFYNQSQWWRAANNHCLKTTGDICHVAPKSRGVCFATFSGDLAPALMTLGAEVDLVGPEGRRTLPLQQLYIGYARHDGSAERRRQALPGAAARRAGHGRARRAHARPALGLRQDPHPPLDRVSGRRRRRGAAPRRRHARRPARRHHRHQPAPGAARGHGTSCAAARSTSACSRASTSSCATRSCR